MPPGTQATFVSVLLIMLCAAEYHALSIGADRQKRIVRTTADDSFDYSFHRCAGNCCDHGTDICSTGNCVHSLHHGPASYYNVAWSGDADPSLSERHASALAPPWRGLWL